MDERKFAYDGNDAEKRKIEYGIKTLYRYGDLFTDDGQYMANRTPNYENLKDNLNLLYLNLS